MHLFMLRMTVTALYLLVFSLSGFAGELDDKYLAAFGLATPLQNGSALQKAILLPATDSGKQPHCGTPLKHKLRQDWAKLEPATQKVLAKQLAAPVLSGTESTLLSTGGRFLIHYTTSGSDSVPSLAWVQTVAQTFEDVATAYVALGWNLAPTSNGAPYDLYLRDLTSQRLYGQTTSTTPVSTSFANSYGSFMEIDKSFTNSIYTNANGGPYTPTQSLQITATHEYHHAIQYGYNFFFDIWYAEATATWHEDELYDGVNQLYNYIPAWFSNNTLSLDTSVSLTTGGGYGRWIFNRYLAEQHGSNVVRSAWVKLATLNSPGNGADIPMVPVLEGLLSAAPFNGNLGTDLFALAKRIYRQDPWTDHSYDTSRIYIHPVAATDTFNNYPVNSSTANSSITLPHYSFAYFKFLPSATSPAIFTLNLNSTSGITATLFKKISGTISEVTPDASGKTFTISDFNGSNPVSDEVVLLVANNTNVDNHQASFSTLGQPATTTEPPATPATTLTPTASSSGGGSGCFIATAAYGSYLHPQVRVLRDFRDRYLLTNAPGRAFVDLYYRLSPPAADFIAQHATLKILVRLMLTPLIFALKFPAVPGAALLLALFGKLIAIRRRHILTTEHS